MRNVVYVSAATAWELGIKQAKGKLSLSVPVSRLMKHVSFEQLAVTICHAGRAASLPLIPAAPFDRLLVAQAIEEELTLMTLDRWVTRYDVSTL